MYAITGGEKTGGFIVRMPEYDSFGALAFLFLPDPMEAMFLTEKEVEELFSYDYLDYVTKWKPEAYEVGLANWKYFAEKQGLDYESK